MAGWPVIAAGLAALVLTTAPAAGAQRPARIAPKPAADLNGLWTNASYTRLERPKKLKGLTMTEAEAKTYEASLAKYKGVPSGSGDPVGQADSEFPDSGEGMARIRGQIRTSWIVSTPDGRLPYTAEARKRLHIDHDAPPPLEMFDNPEDRPQSERCLASNGSGPPQMSEQDANLFRIVQTRDHLALASEKNHEVRLIALGATRDPRQPPSWSGDSVGHWEGATLVVETRGFRQPLVDRDFFYHSDAARITERFTRISPTEIVYAFTVEDPKTFVTPWSAEMLFKAAAGPMFEYACHEGNYSMPTILTAARLGRQEPPPKAAAPAAVATSAK